MFDDDTDENRISLLLIKRVTVSFWNLYFVYWTFCK